MRCGVRQIAKQLVREWLEINGTVKVDNFPARKRVLVLDRKTLTIDVVYSDHTTGKFIWRRDKSTISNDAGRFMVICLDDNKTFNAEAADYITPAISTTTLKL